MADINITVAQALSGLPQFCKSLVDGQLSTAIIVTENGDELALVLMKELSSLRETAYLLSSPVNASRLLVALKQAQSGQVKAQTVDELFEELESENDLQARLLAALKQSQDGELEAQTINELVGLLEKNLQVRLYACLGAAQIGELEPEERDKLIKELEKELQV
jgi:antitoxin YefM